MAEQPSANAPSLPRGAVRWIGRTPARAFLVIFLIVFAAGMALLPFVPPAALVPHTRGEVEAVAVALATEGRFANPYLLPTGATAHMPPAYPALLALLYKGFGLTLTAGHVAWMLKVAGSAAMVAMLPWLSERLGAGRHAGVIGGLAGALVPRWPPQVEYFAAVALGLLLAWHLRRWSQERQGAGSALGLGLAWGAAFHLTPSLLPVLVGCLLFDLWWSQDARKWGWAALTVLGVALACLPWGWRNHAALGEVVFIRSNFGLELRMGNHQGAVADLDQLEALEGHRMPHPRASLEEARQVQELGEIEYMRRARREALDWIRRHPAQYLSLTAQRLFHFWFGGPSDLLRATACGLLTILALPGLRQLWPSITAPQRAAFLIPLLTFPLTYYFVAYLPRYGAPLTGILLVLAGAAVWRWIGGAGPEHQP